MSKSEKLVLSEFLPFRLNRLAAELSRRMSEIYGKLYGIDIPEWRTLVTIGEHDRVTAQFIVHSTRSHKSTISRAVHKLEERGWIKRVEMPEDRRNMALELTKDGRKAYETLVPLVLELERKILEDLGKRSDLHLQTIQALEDILEIGDT